LYLLFEGEDPLIFLGVHLNKLLWWWWEFLVRFVIFDGFVKMFIKWFRSFFIVFLIMVDIFMFDGSFRLT
jgi:hypothetical protein